MEETLLHSEYFREKQKKLAQQILGVDMFDQLSKFFKDIFNECLEHESNNKKFFCVFFTRRCHDIMEIMTEIFAANFSVSVLDNTFNYKYKSILENYCVTDEAVLNMSNDFAQYYVKNHELPKLIIVDEILIHGRALNRFLYTLENNIWEYIKRNHKVDFDELNQDISLKTIRDKLVKSIKIKIFSSSSDTLLLFPRYNKQYNVLCQPSYAKEGWRCCALKFAKLVSSSIVNNVTYSWSFRWEEENNYLDHLLGSQCDEFHCLQTYRQNVKENNYIFLYPNASSPKAVGTIRIKLSGVEYNQKHLAMCVPFFIFDHLNMDNICNLHNQILKDTESYDELNRFLKYYDDMAVKNSFYYDSVYYRWLCETNNLILSMLLMMRFKPFTDMKIRYNLENIEKVIDWGQLTRNFKFFDTTFNVKKALNEIYEWAENLSPNTLDSYLGKLLEGVPPICDGNIRFGNSSAQNCAIWDDTEQKEAIYLGVEDAIAEIAYEAERHAYGLLNTQSSSTDETLTKWGRNHSLGTLLQKCDKKLNFYLQKYNIYADSYQVISIIIHETDYGILGMNPIKNHHPSLSNIEYYQKPMEIYTEQHAGEAALFLLPIRYRNFLFILRDIKSRYGNDVENAILEISRFLIKLYDRNEITGLEYKEYKEKLPEFYQLLFWSGQSPNDWMFSLTPFSLNSKQLEQQRQKDQETKEKYIECYYN